MQSASPSGRLVLGTELAWGRARRSLGGGVAWSAVLVFLLTLSIARSTAAAQWVPGIVVVTPIALAGALLLAIIAVSPVPWPAGLAAGVLCAPVAAWNGAAAAIHQAHPLDGNIIGAGGVSLHPLTVWWSRLLDGSAASDPAAYLFLICLLMWVTGGWLSWCVLRWRKPMLGLIPGAAAFATNLLNDVVAGDQNGYTLAVLVLTLALLLWTTYSGSIAGANLAHVKLTGDARWDFWESGLVAMAALIVIGIMLPPLSTVDRTASAESSLFSNWAALQVRLSRPGAFISGPGGTGTTGFNQDVPLGGPLQLNRDIVFTYTVVGDYAGPRYFRGVNDTLTIGGQWRYGGSGSAVVLRVPISPNAVVSYGEAYLKLGLARFDVTMRRPPIGNADILFYPGLLYEVDRQALATESLPFKGSFDTLMTIDSLDTRQPPTSLGVYKSSVEFSNASVADLQAAGTSYPDWVNQFANLPPSIYRPPAVIDRITALARSIVSAAGAVTPYDQATAIENYLRDPANFSYTLDVPTAPPNTDPIDYFLFTSKRGYCQYFATAMGDMLRSLGIPTRLVNGYGPGQFDAAFNANVVRSVDAHTWVESYFPSYGWITFEPTPQPGYSPITRGTTGTNLCLRDNQCDNPGSVPGAVGPVGPVTPRSGIRNDPSGALSTGGGLRVGVPDAGTLTKIAAVLLAIVLLLFAAATRYLRPRTVMAVWKRTLALANLAGAERRPGETPLELGRRLQRTFPEAAEPVGALASSFVVAAYAPPEEAETARSSVMEAWTALRPLMLRRVLARLRPHSA
ncbi:MAG TPA: transglutaminase domain-containing protein [Candidatus Dormibacteraeota bacterium]